MNNAMFIKLVGKLSFSLGKMVIAFAVIFAAVVTLSFKANSVAAEEASIPRELCSITSSVLSDVNSVSEEELEVVVQATCSFGAITQTSRTKKALLAFALKQPSEIACYEKAYAHLVVRGCDMPS